MIDFFLFITFIGIRQSICKYIVLILLNVDDSWVSVVMETNIKLYVRMYHNLNKSYRCCCFKCLLQDLMYFKCPPSIVIVDTEVPNFIRYYFKEINIHTSLEGICFSFDNTCVKKAIGYKHKVKMML